MKQLKARRRLENQALRFLEESPITVLLGARQTGKTTLARMIADKHQAVHFFDLERATAQEAL